MARIEADKEDLLREAVALTRRVELQLPDESEHIVAGFRPSGDLSIYFGGDVALHFDGENRLRRAFADNCLFRTQGTTLARLERVRTHNETTLRRTDLDETALKYFLTVTFGYLALLLQALSDGSATLIAQVPANDDPRPDLIARLQSITTGPVQLAPAIPGKR